MQRCRGPECEEQPALSARHSGANRWPKTGLADCELVTDRLHLSGGPCRAFRSFSLGPRIDPPCQLNPSAIKDIHLDGVRLDFRISLQSIRDALLDVGRESARIDFDPVRDTNDASKGASEMLRPFDVANRLSQTGSASHFEPGSARYRSHSVQQIWP